MDGLASGQFDPALVPEAPVGLINTDSTKWTSALPEVVGSESGGQPSSIDRHELQ